MKGDIKGKLANFNCFVSSELYVVYNILSVVSERVPTKCTLDGMNLHVSLDAVEEYE